MLHAAMGCVLLFAMHHSIRVIDALYEINQAELTDDKTGTETKLGRISPPADRQGDYPPERSQEALEFLSSQLGGSVLSWGCVSECGGVVIPPCCAEIEPVPPVRIVNSNVLVGQKKFSGPAGGVSVKFLDLF
jgi:hypothetical protein